MTPRKLIFAYRSGQKNMGGKVMRVDQLAAMARDLLGPRYTIETAVVPRHQRPRACRHFLSACKGAIVIFHKSAAASLGPEYRAALRRVAAGICVDHLDIVAPAFERGFIDVHVAASIAGERELIRGLAALDAAPGTQVRHLPHHADPRLRKRAPQQGLVMGYFGLVGNAILPEQSPVPAIIPEYRRSGGIGEGFLEQLGQANFHICTRAPGHRRAKGILPTKPFTKGFNAAAVGANVLVNRQVQDAEYYLGEDYPFFIEDHRQDALTDGIERAVRDFGGPAWQEARHRMDRMAQRVAAPVIVEELEKICRLF